MFAWVLLLLAIFSEIIGTLSMKWFSPDNNATGYGIMLVMIASSYVFLSFAVKRIALGVAYALWEGIGILFITAFSVQLFGEPLPPMKIAGMAVLILGIMLIKTGTTAQKEQQHAHG